MANHEVKDRIGVPVRCFRVTAKDIVNGSTVVIARRDAAVAVDQGHGDRGCPSGGHGTDLTYLGV